MNEYAGHKIWSVGHSNLEWNRFVGMLHRNGICQLADVRSYPGSRANPQFGQARMREGLRVEGIRYRHFPNLGGRRPQSLAKQIGCCDWWTHSAFRSYAVWALGEAFQEELRELETWAATSPTAFCCSEAAWWRCHRRILTDYLLANDWKVEHLAERTFTSAKPSNAAVAVWANDGARVLYPTDRLFD